MWIHCSNEATQRLYNAEFMDAPIVFSSSGTAQVSQAVGEAAIDHYDPVTQHDTDNA